MLDPSIWKRPGRGGHRFVFFAIDQEIQQWLLDWLPAELGPYSVFGLDRVVEKTRPRVRIAGTFEFPLSELTPNLHPPGKERTNFWIRSQKLSPSVDELRQGDLDAQCSINGLMLLQHMGADSEGRRLGMSLANVNRVVNDVTGEIIEHEQYYSLYKRICRHIKNELLYSVIYPPVNGVEFEAKNMMSLGAYAEATSGVPYVLEPGPRSV